MVLIIFVEIEEYSLQYHYTVHGECNQGHKKCTQPWYEVNCSISTLIIPTDLQIGGPIHPSLSL